MRKLLHYRVEISDSSGIIGPTNEFKMTELNVIGENSQFLVVDDLRFTTISKHETEIYPTVGKENICIYAGDRCWGNRVMYTLYTEKQKRAKTIRREIEAAIIKRFGFFMNGLDLSIVTDNRSA